ncbi:MAG TPA: NADH-quinone oxidoreductase subunit J [Myxococcaceae bacterium]|nr:NADH-quinone oxidoreductase subunit J [Myxococcaceae bacterium]
MSAALGFALAAAVVVVAAVLVVRSRNLVRAVLWLALALLGTAALYALLDAPFLAGVQVLTYIGGVVTLMIFGVMVTGRHTGAVAEIDRAGSLRGLLVAGAFLVLVSWAVLATDLSGPPPPPPPTTAELARSLLDEYLLAFEVTSLLLLAAVIGAVVLARRRDPGPAAESRGTLPALPTEGSLR